MPEVDLDGAGGGHPVTKASTSTAMLGKLIQAFTCGRYSLLGSQVILSPLEITCGQVSAIGRSRCAASATLWACSLSKCSAKRRFVPTPAV